MTLKKIPTIGKCVNWIYETNDTVLEFLQTNLVKNHYFKAATRLFESQKIKIASDGSFYINDLNEQPHPLPTEAIAATLFQHLPQPPKNGGTKEKNIELLIHFFKESHRRATYLAWLKNFATPLTSADREKRWELFRKILMHHRLRIEDAWVLESFYYGVVYCLLHGQRHTARIPAILVSSPAVEYQKSTLVRFLTSPFEVLGNSTWEVRQTTSHFMAADLYSQPVIFIEDVDSTKNANNQQSINTIIHNSITLLQVRTELKNEKHAIPINNLSHPIITSNTNRSMLTLDVASDDSRMFEIPIVTHSEKLLDELGWSLKNQTLFEKFKDKIPEFCSLMVRYVLHQFVLPDKNPPIADDLKKRKILIYNAMNAKPNMAELILHRFIQFQMQNNNYHFKGCEDLSLFEPLPKPIFISNHDLESYVQEQQKQYKNFNIRAFRHSWLGSHLIKDPLSAEKEDLSITKNVLIGGAKNNGNRGYKLLRFWMVGSSGTVRHPDYDKNPIIFDDEPKADPIKPIKLTPSPKTTDQKNKAPHCSKCDQPPSHEVLNDEFKIIAMTCPNHFEYWNNKGMTLNSLC